MVNKVPILLGITGTPDRTTTDVEQPDQPRSSANAGNVVLGHGMTYPVARDAPPEGLILKYWSKTSFSGRTKKGKKKTGQHKSNKNVGQAWVEDELGNIIPGYVAQSIREILTSCFHSLAWSGQAPLHSREFGHEARVYIHNVLGGQFPFLLNCEGGRWKINELITQAYSGFVGTHLKKKQTGKRARSESTTSDSDSESDSEAPPAKAPKHSSHSEPSRDLSPSLQPSSNDSLSSSHPLFDDNTPLYTFEGLEAAPSSISAVVRPPTASVHTVSPPIPSQTGASAEPSPSTEPPTTTEPITAADPTPSDSTPSDSTPANSTRLPDVQDTCTDSVGPPGARHASMARNGSAHGDVEEVSAALQDEGQANTSQAASDSGVPCGGTLPQISVSKPFGVTTRKRAPAAQTAAALPGGVTGGPDKAPTPPPQTSDVQDHSAGTDVGTMNVTNAGTMELAPTRRRGPVKAADKYNPNTISVQSFHMRDQIQKNPDILFAECQQLCALLGAEQRKEYQEEVTRANRERKGKARAG